MYKALNDVTISITMIHYLQTHITINLWHKKIITKYTPPRKVFERVRKEAFILKVHYTLLTVIKYCVFTRHICHLNQNKISLWNII